MSPATTHGTGRPTPRPTRVRRLGNAIRKFLADETRSGLLVIGIALLALTISNSPLAHVYESVSHAHVGPASIGLNLTVHEWAADGLLTIFFFVVGLELKTEFVTGALRDMKEAALPMIAAAFGMIGPAIVYTTVQILFDSTAWSGWAVPTATDIAFAVAILSIFGKGLPPAARTFLLTLAVVDDLLAIIVIAVFFSTGINIFALGASILVIAVFAFATVKGQRSPWILVPLGVLAWAFMANSGVHATIAGVALGLVVPAARTRQGQMTHDFAHAIGPWSAGLALPVFAFFAAGVPVLGAEGGIVSALADPVTFGVALALPLGKVLGIWGSVAALTRWTKLRLGHGVDLPDVAAMGLLAGIGFTVAMLIGGLAFSDEVTVFHARFGVIIGTFASAFLAALALKLRLAVRARGEATHHSHTTRHPQKSRNSSKTHRPRKDSH